MLLTSALMVTGPFNFGKLKENGLPDLHLNPYSWSKVASIIYLDSPVGTGFSYTVNASTYYTADLQTAADSHLFLLKVHIVTVGVSYGQEMIAINLSRI